MTAPAALTGETVLTLLSALTLPSAAAQELVAVQRLFEHPSTLHTSTLNKWLNRLNSAVTSRDSAAAELAASVIEQDTEGYAAAQYGKAWMGACQGTLSSANTAPESLPAFLTLARALVSAAPYAPAFEREVVQPAMGKLAVAMGRLVERLLESAEWDAMVPVLDATRALLLSSPAPFRPAVPTLRASLTSVNLGLNSAPQVVRMNAAKTMAVLHLAGGKAASPLAWGADMREALGGLAASLATIANDAWEEEPPRTAPFPPPASLPEASVDPLARTAAALQWIEGYTDAAIALLRLPSARPVPVPVAQLVACSLRALNLTLDTPTLAHIAPQHHAALVAALPRIWLAGMSLLGGTIAACGDHVVPHLGAILEHSVYLLERVPHTMTDSRFKLLQFHFLLMDAYPAPILPLEYTTRLLRFSLGVLGTLLDSRPVPTSAPATGGRKNKKRARGAEDALLGGLEGRAPRATSPAEAAVILAALRITPQLHTAPLLAPALLTFSLRLHLSLHLFLRSRPAGIATPDLHRRLTVAVADALQAAASLEASGHARDVRSLIIAMLPSTAARHAHLDMLLHPPVPPMARIMPALAQLHMFAPESEAEAKVRKELGFGMEGDVVEEDEEMVVDEPVRAAPVAAPVVSVPAVAPVAVAPVAAAPVAAAPAPFSAAPAPFSAPVPAPAPIVPAPAAEPVESAAQAQASAMAANFMSAPAATAVREVVEIVQETVNGEGEGDDDDDDVMPELDSGSSDEEMDDDDE